jgi:hypothetical protein
MTNGRKLFSLDDKEPIAEENEVSELLSRYKALSEKSAQELREAEEEQKKRQMWTQLSKAASGIGAGIAGLGAQKAITPETKSFDELQKMWQQNLENVRKRQKEEKTIIQDQIKALSKATGTKSKKFQQTTMSDPSDPGRVKMGILDTSTGEIYDTGLTKGYAGQVRTDPYTGELVGIQPGQLEGRITPISTKAPKRKKEVIEKAEKAETIPNITREDLNPKQRKGLGEIQEDFDKAETEIRDFESTMEGLGSFVQANLDGTIGVIKRQLARTVGQEKGVMTDKDVAAFGGTDRVIEMIAQYAHAKIYGGMTKEIQNNFNNIIKVARRNIEKKRGIINNKFYSRIKQIAPDANDESLKQLLHGPKTELGLPTEKPEIRKYANEHFQGDYKKALEFLKRKGYIKD